MKGEGALAKLIRARFDNTVRKLGLGRDRIELRTDLFRRPAPEPLGQGRPTEQLSLI